MWRVRYVKPDAKFFTTVSEDEYESRGAAAFAVSRHTKCFVHRDHVNRIYIVHIKKS